MNLSWTHLYKLQHLPSHFCFLLVYNKLPHSGAESITHFIFRQFGSQMFKGLDKTRSFVPQYVPSFETANRVNSSIAFSANGWMGLKLESNQESKRFYFNDVKFCAMFLINNPKKPQRRKEQIKKHTSESSAIYGKEFTTEVTTGGSKTLVLCHSSETRGVTAHSAWMDDGRWGVRSFLLDSSSSEVEQEEDWDRVTRSWRKRSWHRIRREGEVSIVLEALRKWEALIKTDFCEGFQHPCLSLYVTVVVQTRTVIFKGT